MLARSRPLVALLVLQACLLFWRLDLLPVWGDELHTLRTIDHPVSEIAAIITKDVHPPLYFVALHAWTALPLPWAGIGALRAFSVMWALLATLLLDIFWTRSWKGPARWIALSLFALSPCLLLYGRMARSYSMQVALVLVCLGLLRQWMEEPGSMRLALGSFASMVTLLYTHYVPGLAVLAGFALVGWHSVGVRRAAGFALMVVAAFIPWVTGLIGAVRWWGAADRFTAHYAVSNNLVLEHIVKAGFGLVSLTIGESFLGVSLLLAPVMLALAFLGVRIPQVSRWFVALLIVAAAIGYFAVAWWDSYPFIPARMLWLLPFLSMAVALGISELRRPAIQSAVILAILLSFVSSDLLYFRRENFLNPGYAAPLREIAGTLNRQADPGDLILVDAYNTDADALAALLSGRTPFVILEQKRSAEASNLTRSAATVWIVRNTRDVSPGLLTTRLQSEACAGRQERDTMLEPYATWQRTAMRLAGFASVPTHFYQLTECRPASKH